MILLDQVTHWYNKDSSDELKALDNVSLSINEGEFIVLLGHNGSGKSTLSKLLNALLVPHIGKVTVDGMDSSDIENIYKIRQLVGMVFQNPDSQLVATTVEDELAFGPENMGLPPTEILERIEESLKIVDMLKFRKFQPHKLSGGQKQKIAIASVIAMRPKYMVLDEATSMLDPKGRADLLSTIVKLNREEHLSVVMITQNMEEVLLAHRILVLKQGKLAYDGSPINLFAKKSKVKELGLALPVIVSIAHRLAERGIPLTPKAVTLEKLSEELLNYYKRS